MSNDSEIATSVENGEGGSVNRGTKSAADPLTIIIDAALIKAPSISVDLNNALIKEIEISIEMDQAEVLVKQEEAAQSNK